MPRGLKSARSAVRAKVTQPYRELLHRYTALLNTERRRLGLRPASPAEVAGAMICFILDVHQQSILDGYEALRTSAFLQKYDEFLAGDDAATSGATVLTESARGAAGD